MTKTRKWLMATILPTVVGGRLHVDASHTSENNDYAEQVISLREAMERAVMALCRRAVSLNAPRPPYALKCAACSVPYPIPVMICPRPSFVSGATNGRLNAISSLSVML